MTETVDSRHPASPAMSDSRDALGESGGVIDGLQLVCGTRVAVGRAHTARVIDGDADNIPGLAEYLDSIPTDAVLVLGWDASSTASVIGGLAATRAAAAGATALVVDGYVRDVDEILPTGLVTWSRGRTPRSGKGRLAIADAGTDVQLGGVTVRQGDLVVADQTGVVVVASAEVDQIVAKAEDLDRREEIFRAKLADGAGFGAAFRDSGTM